MCCYPNFKSSPELEQSSLLTYMLIMLMHDFSYYGKSSIF